MIPILLLFQSRVDVDNGVDLPVMPSNVALANCTMRHQHRDSLHDVTAMTRHLHF